MTLTVPIVDEQVALNAWRRSLHIVHCLLCPMFALIATQSWFKFYIIVNNLTFVDTSVMVGPMPLLLCVLLPGSAIAVVFIVFTKRSSPPKWHQVRYDLVQCVTLFCSMWRLSDLACQFFGFTWLHRRLLASCHCSVALPVYRMKLWVCFNFFVLHLNRVDRAGLVKLVGGRC